MFHWLGVFDSLGVVLLVVIATLTSLSITAIIYILSSILNYSKWQAWAKKEIGQVFLNLLFIWLITFMFLLVEGTPTTPGLMENTITTFIPVVDVANHKDDAGNPLTVSQAWNKGAVWNSNAATPGCLIYKPEIYSGSGTVSYPIQTCVAVKHLSDMLGLTRDSLNFLFYYGGIYAIGQNTALKFGLYQKGFLTFPFAGYSVVVDQTKELFDILMTNYVFLLFQLFLIDFSAQVMFPLFLILGLVLRSFQITRKFGGFLMAVAITLFFVMPLIYIINYSYFYSTDEVPSNYLNTRDDGEGRVYYHNLHDLSEVEPLYNTLKTDTRETNLLNDGEKHSALEFFWVGILDDMDAITNPGDILWIFWKFGVDLVKHLVGITLYELGMTAAGTVIPNVHAGMGGFLVNWGGWIHMAARLFMFGLVSPLLTLYLVFVSIKHFSKIFGGETQIIGLSHFL
ncbi:hypothetical protein KO465_00300 [Candidatus Micrarchaeota archaeon]|nr:hypothetical protein [Candidatus Micrarchaeota archaeon]